MRPCARHWEYSGNWLTFLLFSQQDDVLAILLSHYVVPLLNMLQKDSGHLEYQDFDVSLQIRIIQHIRVIV